MNLLLKHYERNIATAIIGALLKTFVDDKSADRSPSQVDILSGNARFPTVILRDLLLLPQNESMFKRKYLGRVVGRGSLCLAPQL